MFFKPIFTHLAGCRQCVMCERDCVIRTYPHSALSTNNWCQIVTLCFHTRNANEHVNITSTRFQCSLGISVSSRCILVILDKRSQARHTHAYYSVTFTFSSTTTLLRLLGLLSFLTPFKAQTTFNHFLCILTAKSSCASHLNCLSENAFIPQFV